MVTILFHDTIFGPIHSRRLGTSLGINLTPNDGKICSFDCIYCEAGYNAQGTGTTGISPREEVRTLLEQKLAAMKANGDRLDVITFSGNGEPTLHPEFKAIVHDVITQRNHYFPEAKVCVLSNATMASRLHVAEALKMVDRNILKLDSAIYGTFKRLNRPVSPNVLPEGIIDDLKQFDGRCIVQTMMVRGEHDGETIEQAPALRKFLPFALCSALVVAMFTAAVADRKAILRKGREMLLPLIPKDPRIFMLGDYMELTYELEGEKFAEEGPLCLPLAIDEKGIAHPSPDRLPADADCSKVPAPVVQVERSAFGNMRLRLPHRYYFEQGLARVYADAAFAVLRCDRNNNCLLKGLADADRRPLLPPRK